MSDALGSFLLYGLLPTVLIVGFMLAIRFYRLRQVNKTIEQKREIDKVELIEGIKKEIAEEVVRALKREGLVLKVGTKQ